MDSPEYTTNGPNPSGLCMCGCGELAPIATGNDKRYGIVKGLPQRYIKGHQKWKSPVEYVVSENGCWVWQRSVNSAGYGHLYVDGKHKFAHVHYWERASGLEANVGREIDSQVIHHKCGNKLCVNPDHLELMSVTNHRLLHGIMKITDQQVRDLRFMASNGIPYRKIAEHFGVSQSHVQNIMTGNKRIRVGGMN